MDNFLFRNTDYPDTRGCIPIVPKVKDVYFFKTNTATAPTIAGGILNVSDLYGNKGKYNWFNFSRNAISHISDGYYEPSSAVSKVVKITGIENGAAPCCDNFTQFTVTLQIPADGCGLAEINRTYFTSTDCQCPTLIAVRLADAADQITKDEEVMERLGSGSVAVTSTAITITSALTNFNVFASAATIQTIDPFSPTALTPAFIRDTLKRWNPKSTIIPEIVDGTTYRIVQLVYMNPMSSDNSFGSGSYGSREGQITYTENLVWLIFQDSVSNTHRDLYLGLLGGASLVATQFGVLDSIVVKKALVPDYPYCSTKTDAGDAAALAAAALAYETAYPGKIVSLRRVSYNGTDSKYEVVMRGQATVPTVSGHTLVKGQC